MNIVLNLDKQLTIASTRIGNLAAFLGDPRSSEKYGAVRHYKPSETIWLFRLRGLNFVNLRMRMARADMINILFIIFIVTVKLYKNSLESFFETDFFSCRSTHFQSFPIHYF